MRRIRLPTKSSLTPDCGGPPDAPIAKKISGFMADAVSPAVVVALRSNRANRGSMRERLSGVRIANRLNLPQRATHREARPIHDAAIYRYCGRRREHY